MSNVRPLSTVNHKHLFTFLLATAVVFAIAMSLLSYMPEMHKAWHLPGWAVTLLFFLFPSVGLAVFCALIWYYVVTNPSSLFLALSTEEQARRLSPIRWRLILPPIVLMAIGVVVAALWK